MNAGLWLSFLPAAEWVGFLWVFGNASPEGGPAHGDVEAIWHFEGCRLRLSQYFYVWASRLTAVGSVLGPEIGLDLMLVLFAFPA